MATAADKNKDADTVKDGDTVKLDKGDNAPVNHDEVKDAAVDSDDRPANSPLRIQQRQARRTDAELDNRREVAPWDRDDAPKGSTSESLLTTDENGKTRVSGPTHYAALADGRIVGGYGIGTHHDDGDGVVPIVSHYAG